jgi:rod shape-determining protein MreD
MNSLDSYGPSRPRISWLGVAVLLVAPIAAICFQFYVPKFFPYLKYLEMPLLVTVYFGLVRREPAQGLLFGMAVGLLQDSLSDQPMGMLGIVKTLVGYLAASTSVRLDAANPLIRIVLVFCFFFFHQFTFWVLARALLGETYFVFRIEDTLVLAALNGAVAVPLFSVLDTLRK